MKKAPVRVSRVLAPALCGLLISATALHASAQSADAAAPADEPRFDVYEYVIEGNTLLPSAVIERLVAPHMGPARRFADVEQARSSLEKAYQEAGYLSVVVSLPNQQVDRGEVKLEVVEAALNRVSVSGAQHHLPSRIQEAVPALREGTVPHFPTVQRQLAEVQSATLQVTPLVNASASGDAIDVELKVEDKAPYFGSLQYTNAQSYNTTRGRINATAGLNNLFQLGHTLGLSWQYAPYRPKDNNTLSLLYGIPLSARDDLLLTATNSNSDTLTKVSGSGPSSTLTKGFFAGLRWTHRLQALNWPVRHSVFAGLDYKHNRDFNTFVDGLITQRPPLRYTLLTGNNLNPRAFRLDLENGLLIDDPQGQWLAPRRTELAQIFQHVTRIEGYQQLQTLVDYPPAVGKFLRRVSRVRIERLLYRIL